MDEEFLSNSSRILEKSHIQTALQIPVTPSTISFALGMPDTSLLPLDQYKMALDKIYSTASLQYSPPVDALKVQIVDLMKKRQVSCNKNQIFLTSGAQQAMMLITKLLVDEGDNIIIEDATYTGFIQIANSLQANLINISVDNQNGISIEELESVLKKQKKPKLIYTITEGHNPLGISLSKEKRLKLINLAQTYKVPILEDDAYGFINYEEKVEAPLRAYSDEWIFYIGSFSKILSPTTRVGWIIVPEVLVEKLEILKEASDINTATFAQHIISSYIEMDHLSAHLSLIKKYYKEKRDIMMKALKQHIPEMQFIVPSSGFFIWGRLPSTIATDKLFKLALETKNVSFLPGSAFGISNKNNLTNCLRLSFAFCPLDLIEIGIKKLKEAIQLII